MQTLTGEGADDDVMGTGESAVGIQAITSLVRFAGPGIAIDMIELFLAITPGRVQTACAAVKSGDRTTLRSMSHTMKSGAAQLGALGLHRACATLEEEAPTARPDRLERLVDRIVDETATAAAWLELVRERLKSTGMVTAP